MLIFLDARLAVGQYRGAMNAATDTAPLAAPVTVDAVTLKAVLKGMYRDSAYRGAAIARRFGGQGTVTVYSVCLPGGLRAKVDAFGATPADRTACAKAWVELELLRRAGATDDQVAASPAARVIATRGAARLAR